MPSTKDERANSLLPALFLVSGISGLLYEVVWFRMLVRVFGCTIHAVSTVLVVFMSGLALGSFAAAGWLRGKRGTLLVYGAIEVLIGLAAVGSTWAMLRLPEAFGGVLAALGHRPAFVVTLRLLAAATVLLPPTALMGATLPILTSASFGDEEGRARRAGLLYGLNTLGAVIGILAAGFVLLAVVGESATVWWGACLNVLVGLCAAWLSRGTSARPVARGEARRPPPDPETRRRTFVVLVIYGVSGFCALGYEVVWSRLLILLLGNSVYGFSAMLAVYLVGVSVGSVVAARVVSPRTPLFSAFSMLQTGVGLTALVSLHLFVAIGVLRDDPRYTFSVLWSAADFLQLPLNSALVVLPVTLLLGAMFPVVGRICCSGDLAAASIGRVYGYNTVGAILGSACVGFLLLPRLGTLQSFVLLSATSLLLGMATLLAAPAVERVGWHRLALGAGLPGIIALAFWAPGDPFRTVLAARLGPAEHIIRHQEDAAATVTVISHDLRGRRFLTLSINGLHVSGTGAVGRFMVHLPLLFHPSPKKALLIGLGAGEAYCGALDHGVETTVVELVPAVRDLFPLFHPDSARYRNRPDARIVIDDGRNYLLGSRERFDLVLVDGTPPIYASGMVNLYSNEFARMAADHLTPDGIFTLWLPTYLFERDYWSVARSFAETFPRIATWADPRFSGMFLMGSRSRSPLFDVEPETLAARARARRLPMEINPRYITSNLVLDDGEMRMAARAHPMVTDDRPYTEFPLFHFLQGDTLQVTNEFLRKARRR